MATQRRANISNTVGTGVLDGPFRSIKNFRFWTVEDADPYKVIYKFRFACRRFVKFNSPTNPDYLNVL